jgi:hypothetical protein
MRSSADKEAKLRKTKMAGIDYFLYTKAVGRVVI